MKKSNQTRRFEGPEDRHIGCSAFTDDLAGDFLGRSARWTRAGSSQRDGHHLRWFRPGFPGIGAIQVRFHVHSVGAHSLR